MLKPSDVKLVAPERNAAQDSLEAHIDQHLRDASSWPVVIRSTRAAWRLSDISAVLARYREVGWTVIGPRAGMLCALQPSDYGAPIANRRDEELEHAIQQALE